MADRGVLGCVESLNAYGRRSRRWNRDWYLEFVLDFSSSDALLPVLCCAAASYFYRVSRPSGAGSRFYPIAVIEAKEVYFGGRQAALAHSALRGSSESYQGQVLNKVAPSSPLASQVGYATTC